jgi:hypothetical protein
MSEGLSMSPPRLLLVLLVAGVAVSAIVACGSGSSSSTGAETTRTTGGGETTGATGGQTARATGGSRIRQFETKAGDNSLQEVGREASETELREAAQVLHGYLDARAAGDLGAACGYLSSRVAKELGAQFGGRGGERRDCPSILRLLSTGLPAGALREAAIADVGALRVEGSSGFLFYHGAHGADYFMPVTRETGEWKVAAFAPSAVP